MLTGGQQECAVSTRVEIKNVLCAHIKSMVRSGGRRAGEAMTSRVRMRIPMGQTVGMWLIKCAFGCVLTSISTGIGCERTVRN